MYNLHQHKVHIKRLSEVLTCTHAYQLPVSSSSKDWVLSDVHCRHHMLPSEAHRHSKACYAITGLNVMTAQLLRASAFHQVRRGVHRKKEGIPPQESGLCSSGSTGVSQIRKGQLVSASAGAVINRIWAVGMKLGKPQRIYTWSYGSGSKIPGKIVTKHLTEYSHGSHDEYKSYSLRRPALNKHPRPKKSRLILYLLSVLQCLGWFPLHSYSPALAVRGSPISR